MSKKSLAEPDGDALVLNSTALKTRALPYLENPQTLPICKAIIPSTMISTNGTVIETYSCFSV